MISTEWFARPNATHQRVI